MIEQAMHDFEVDLENSWMIGDKILDVELGFNAKVKSVLVKTGYGEKSVVKLERQPDIIAKNLLEAVLQIIQSSANKP
jgi:UDP-N-acetylmuramoyl-tripeptide--D-alanyl-D-alanine ligase